MARFRWSSSNHCFILVLSLLMISPLLACDRILHDDHSDSDQDCYHAAALEDGQYQVSYVMGFSEAGAANLSKMKAELRRSSNELILTFADGSSKVLNFASRPQDGWQKDCFGNSMDSCVKGEVADLLPVPLEIESRSINDPIAYAKCSERVMIILGSSHLSDSAYQGDPEIKLVR